MREAEYPPGKIPAHILRCMSPEDRARMTATASLLPQTAETPFHVPPDGWRGRLAATPVPRQPKGYAEHAMQAELFRWSQDAQTLRSMPSLALLFAVPNQAKVSQAAGRYFAAEGKRPGVPDLILPVPRAGFGGLALELKIYPNKPTPAQEQWLDALEAIGWRCCVAYDLATAKAFLQSYLQPVNFPVNTQS